MSIIFLFANLCFFQINENLYVYIRDLKAQLVQVCSFVKNYSQIVFQNMFLKFQFSVM
jgi:hypothetical protein